MVDFATYILSRHPEGLTSADAVLACWLMYCADARLPEWVNPAVQTRSEIAEAFSILADVGGVQPPETSLEAPMVRADDAIPIHSPAHWDRVVADLLRTPPMLDSLDIERVLSLLRFGPT